MYQVYACKDIHSLGICLYDEGPINLSLYAYICLHCLFTFACSSSAKSIVRAFKGIIYRSTYIDNPLLTENISNKTNVPFAFSSKRDQKCINVQSVRCSSSSVHFIVEAGAGHWRKITTHRVTISVGLQSPA